MWQLIEYGAIVAAGVWSVSGILAWLRSWSFPTVNAEVEQSQCRRLREAGRCQSTGGASFAPDIRAWYTFDGRRYWWSFSGLLGAAEPMSEEAAVAICNQYPKDATISLLVDRRTPALAHLRRPPVAWPLICIAIIVAYVAAQFSRFQNWHSVGALGVGIAMLIGWQIVAQLLRCVHQLGNMYEYARADAVPESKFDLAVQSELGKIGFRFWFECKIKDLERYGFWYRQFIYISSDRKTICVAETLRFHICGIGIPQNSVAFLDHFDNGVMLYTSPGSSQFHRPSSTYIKRRVARGTRLADMLDMHHRHVQDLEERYGITSLGYDRDKVVLDLLTVQGQLLESSIYEDDFEPLVVEQEALTPALL